MKFGMGWQNLRYRILSGRNSRLENRTFHNKSFRFWKDFWQKIYSDQGAAEHFAPSDFVRQDFISVLYSGLEIVGCHGHTIIDLESEADSSLGYLKFYENDFLDRLRQECPKLFTFEYLAIAPKWRKERVAGHSLAEVLIGLGCRIFLQSTSDLGIATARRDVGIPTMASRWGFFPIQENIMRRNFPCDIIGLNPQKHCPHSSNEVNECVEHLWKNRTEEMESRTILEWDLAAQKKAA